MRNWFSQSLLKALLRLLHINCKTHWKTTHINQPLNIYIYIYIYVCVRVCVGVCACVCMCVRAKCILYITINYVLSAQLFSVDFHALFFGNLYADSQFVMKWQLIIEFYKSTKLSCRTIKKNYPRFLLKKINKCIFCFFLIKSKPFTLTSINSRSHTYIHIYSLPWF